MTRDIKAILYPKSAGLSNKNKPSAIVVYSPWDNPAESALSSAAKRVEEQGYRVLNKGSVHFNMPTLKGKLSWIQGSEVTLWVESHGAPGALFSKPENSHSAEICAISELQATCAFAKWALSIESEFNVRVKYVVLSACNSATEYLDETTDNYFLSPARLLSLLLPHAHVVGFIGYNCGAKVTNIWQLTGGEYTTVTLSLFAASTLFIKGAIHETIKEALFCPVKQIPKFIREFGHFEFSSDFFSVMSVDKGLAEFDKSERCFGLWQKNTVLEEISADDEKTIVEVPGASVELSVGASLAAVRHLGVFAKDSAGATTQETGLPLTYKPSLGSEYYSLFKPSPGSDISSDRSSGSKPVSSVVQPSVVGEDEQKSQSRKPE